MEMKERVEEGKGREGKSRNRGERPIKGKRRRNMGR